MVSVAQKVETNRRNHQEGCARVKEAAWRKAAPEQPGCTCGNTQRIALVVARALHGKTEDDTSSHVEYAFEQWLTERRAMTSKTLSLTADETSRVKEIVRSSIELKSSWAELEEAVQTAFPKLEAKEVIRLVSKAKVGFTGHAWPIWCIGDADEQSGICGSERTCSFHGGKAIRQPANKAVSLPRCRACRRGEHKRHKARFRKKGLPVDCTCAVCDPERKESNKKGQQGLDDLIAKKRKEEKGMAAKKRKSKAAPDEEETTTKSKSKKKGKSKGKPSSNGSGGLSAADAATKLKVTPRDIRRTMRKLGMGAEGGRYALSDAQVKKVAASLKEED